MRINRIAFWSFVLGGYAVSRSFPYAYRDQVAFLMLFLFYILFLMYKKLSKKHFSRDDILIGIPAIYGLIVAALQYYNYLRAGNFFVWGIFVLVAIVSLGYMGVDRSSKHTGLR